MPRTFAYSILLGAVFCAAATAASTFTTRIDDPHAVYLAAPDFAVHADGKADDTAALQAAIDKAENNVREGILFVPSGHYRLTRTVYIWPGVRVIGYGATRPVFELAPNTPGFQNGVAVMVMFTGARARAAGTPPSPNLAAGRGAVSASGATGGPGRGFRIPFPPPDSVPPNPNISDAGAGTFYSAMSNIDFEIGDGNPAAVAIRCHFAQHAYLSHMDFHTGSGLAALTEVGNEAEDLRFFGGRYGILTDKTSPAWQYTLIDSEFQGQRESAIREHEVLLTLVRDTFHDLPTAIDIDPRYSDQVWVKDSRFENISGPVIVVSNEKNPLTQIGFENAVLKNAPQFALLRESGTKIAGKGPVYRVANFNYGLILPGEGAIGTIGTKYNAAPLAAMPAPLARALPQLPPTTDWVNVRTLGVKGDGTTDDTAAIRRAIAAHRVLYFPGGHYVVTDTLTLKPDTVLIGLHPTFTQFDVPDDAPAFRNGTTPVGSAVPVVAAPSGGTNILSGIGISTGGSNPRAAGVIWRASEASLIDDVRFLGGHGSGTNPYNNDHTADPDLHKRWDGQYPSLWITDGGGGSFADIWTPDTFAQAGFFVSNTTTPGHVYELSNEHHVRNEIKLDHVENWDFDAPQTEEESGESPDALSLEIDWSKNITIANYHAYRVTRSRAPFPAAVRIYHSEAIHFRNVYVNAESGYGAYDANGPGTFLRVSKYPYENAIDDVTHHLQTRERLFAFLDVSAAPATPLADDATAILEPGTKLRKLEDGFFSIAGAALDSAGKLFFVDRHEQRIYSWSATDGLTVERDSPLDPVNLVFDKSGDLLVLSSAGPESTVYSYKPGSPKDQITVLPLEVTKPRPEARAAIPGNFWNNGEFKTQLDFNTMVYKTLAQMFAEDVTKPAARQYVSPDGSVFLPAGRVFQQGAANSIDGWRFSDNLDTYGFVTARPGERIYVSSESEDATYSATVKPDGSLADLKLFTQRGGESVATDAKGNVYVANGQIFAYDKTGKEIGRIDVPERPLDLVVSGRTLYILSHHSLYQAKLHP